MNNQNDRQQFVCKSCGSELQGKEETCCGAEREEKKETSACMACSCPCDEHRKHAHK